MSLGGDEPAVEADVDSATRRRVSLVARVLAVGLVVTLLILLVFSLARSSSGGAYVGRVDKGGTPPAPPFDLPVIWPRVENWPTAARPLIDDGRLTLRELRGYPVVVNFWASWCNPCKEEAPAFARAARRYRGRVAFVGIDVQDLTRAARGFLRRYKANYVSVRDRSNKTYTAYGLTGIPETYFIDARGRTIDHAIGRLTYAELTRRVDELLKK